jgi:NAD(P)-dependent dehydrogenase (short-subunit alcohol dehydrogenase family)
MSGRLEGRSTIVTAAGSGIGRATALAFAKAGARVVINDLNEESLAETLGLVHQQGGTALSLPGDATTRGTNESLVEAAVKNFGGLDCIHLVAGGAVPKATLETTDDQYRKIIALNLDSAWMGAQAALPVMQEQRRGSVIGTTSGAGIGSVMGLAAYGAAKAGVISLMRSIAHEFGALGIRANTISPGPMATPGLLSVLTQLPTGVEGFESQIPLGRLGTAEEIADAAVFLASDESRYVSGALLPVDGAIHSTLSSPDPMAGSR